MAGLKHEPAAVPRRPSLGTGALLLLVLIAPTGSSVAGTHEPLRLDAIVACDPAVAERVLPVLRASLEHQGLQLVATVVSSIEPRKIAHAPVEPATNVLVAHLWLDLVATPPTMYLIDAETRLVYIRPLPVHADPDPVEIELIRFVLDSSVEALVRGQIQGISRDDFERSLSAPAVSLTTAAPPAPAAPMTAERPWLFSVGYAGTLLSSDFLAHGLVAGAEFSGRGLHFGMALLQRLPVTVDRAQVRTRLLSSGVRLYVLRPIALGPRTVVAVGLGLGVDATRVAPAGAGATSPFWVSDPLVLAIVAIERSLGRVRLSIPLGVEWDALAAKYEVSRADGTVTVWTPQRFRPFMLARIGTAF